MEKTGQPAKPTANTATRASTGGRAQIFTPGKDGYTAKPTGGMEAKAQPAAKPAPAPAAKVATPAPAPAAKPAPTPAAKPPPPASKSQALAQSVVGSFVKRLTQEADRRGGTLTKADIERLKDDFEKNTEVLQAVLQKSFDEYVEARETAIWDQSRESPFSRLMVKQFSRTFPDKNGKTLAEGALPRRIIPGFLIAMNMMLGPELVEESQNKCQDLVDRLRDTHKEAFSWDHMYAHDTTTVILDTAMVAMVDHFDNLERRRTWFIELVNTHLPTADSDEEPDAENWQMDEKSFSLFIRALFGSLRKKLSTEEGRAELSKHNGKQVVTLAARILKTLFPKAKK